MTPEEALAILDPWAADCRRRGPRKRAEKLEGFARVIRELMAQRPVGLLQAAADQASEDVWVGEGDVVLGNAKGHVIVSNKADLAKIADVKSTWRDKARAFGIPMYQRKRADVEADIAAREGEDA